MNRMTLISFAAGILIGTVATAASGSKGQVIRNAASKTAPSGKAKAIPLIHKGMGAESAYMGLLEMEAGTKVPVHRDPTEEYIYVLAGGGTVTIDGEAHIAYQGDAIFMPANAEVSFVSSEKGETHVLQVFAPGGPESKYDSWK
jgi:quercetin dioxygenase-like cupin family protein